MIEKRGKRLGRGWWYVYRDGEGMGIECGPYLTRCGARFSRWIWGRALSVERGVLGFRVTMLTFAAFFLGIAVHEGRWLWALGQGALTAFWAFRIGMLT